MMSQKKLLFVGLAFLVMGGLISCQSAATPTLEELSQPGIAVGISDDSCPTVQLNVGQYVSWTNQGKQEHIVRVKSNDREIVFDSGILKPGDNFEVNFTQADTYEYECSADGSLKGTITVEP